MCFFICYYCYSYDVYDIEGKLLLLLLLLLFLLFLFLLLLLILLLISSRSYFLSCFGIKSIKCFQSDIEQIKCKVGNKLHFL